MDIFIENYWLTRLDACKKALERNNFEVFVVDNPEKARATVLEEIIPGIAPKSFAWGDSLTFYATGILEALGDFPDIEVIKTFDKTVSREQITERRRQALLVDLFITGTNAVTETGSLVNLDMVGNRVAGITFGPKHVIILVGRNKIVPDLDYAVSRIKNYSAPVNAIRHSTKTPCVKTAQCMDCKSPDRICNTWVITEKSFPKGRIKIVLVNKDLGY